MELVALLAAVAVAGATALSSARGATRRSSTPEPTLTAELSLQRPRELPGFAPFGTVARDINAFDAWVDHPGYAVTPQGILGAFRQAEMGYPQRQCDLFDDLIENDCTLRDLFENRENSVAGKPWVVQADGVEGDSELGARVLGAALRRLPMTAVIQHLLTVNRYGYSAAEIDWGIMEFEGRPWIVPVWITAVPARRFRIASVGSTTGLDELRLYADVTRPLGDELQPAKWITLRRPGAWIARAGLMRTGAWPAMGKRYGFRDWLIYSQRFGMPLPVATYADGADEEAINVAEEIVKKIGSDGGAVKPAAVTLDMLDATKGGDNSKSHGGLIAHCNAEMSKLISSGTLSNDNAGSGGASYALGAVHADGRWTGVEKDANLIKETTQAQLGEPFMRFNGLRGGNPMLIVQVARELSPMIRVQIASTLRNELGAPVSMSQLYQDLGVRAPSSPEDAAPGMPNPVAKKPDQNGNPS